MEILTSELLLYQRIFKRIYRGYHVSIDMMTGIFLCCLIMVRTYLTDLQSKSGTSCHDSLPELRGGVS